MMPLRKLESAPGRMTLVVHGTLTSHDVTIIRQVLASLEPPRDLTLDLAAAPAPLAPALLQLATAMGEARGRLRLRGLTVASERLLRLLGVEVSSMVPVAPGRVEELET